MVGAAEYHTVAGSIPSQGTYGRELIDVSLPLSSSSLKSVGRSSGEDGKKSNLESKPGDRDHMLE